MFGETNEDWIAFISFINKRYRLFVCWWEWSRKGWFLHAGWNAVEDTEERQLDTKDQYCRDRNKFAVSFRLTSGVKFLLAPEFPQCSPSVTPNFCLSPALWWGSRGSQPCPAFCRSNSRGPVCLPILAPILLLLDTFKRGRSEHLSFLIRTLHPLPRLPLVQILTLSV